MRHFRKRMGSRRFLVVSAIIGLVVLGGSAIAYAAYPTNSVAVMTGCLTTSGTGSGNIVNVAMGTSPAKACGGNQKQVQISGGTITQVTAGTGLTTAGSGGSGGTGFINNGFATLGLQTGYQLPQDCTSGQVAKSSGSNTWSCAADNNTTYSGTDFATSGQDCPAGQFATGIDGNGALKCDRPCMVVNATTKMPYMTLQAAEIAATAGDTLLVNGTCIGNTTIDKALTIKGQSNGGKSASLDGGGSGTVLTVCAATTVDNLVIAHGSGTVLATVTICGLDFTGTAAGGGIIDLGKALTLNNSTVTANTADFGGGMWLNADASVTLNDSVVSHNTADNGGGFNMGNYLGGGTVTLNGTSSIDHNSAAEEGGGLETSGTFIMNDSSTVHDNTASTSHPSFLGGGICNFGGTLTGTVDGTNVYNNHPDNIADFPCH